jgi:hypothetical protein
MTLPSLNVWAITLPFDLTVEFAPSTYSKHYLRILYLPPLDCLQNYLPFSKHTTPTMSRRPNPAADRAEERRKELKNLVKLEENKSCADCKRNKRMDMALILEGYWLANTMDRPPLG